MVLLRYPKQFRNDYCLARVSAIHPSSDGLVRKVTVEFRKKNPREAPEVYHSKPLISEEVMIHRLHRLEIVDQDVAMVRQEGSESNDDEVIQVKE